MADKEFDEKISSQPESNFDHDFEQLDPYAAPPSQDDVVSSSAFAAEQAEEDLYSASPVNTSEAEPKLVNFDEEKPAPVKPSAPEADSSSRVPAAVVAPKKDDSQPTGAARDSWFQNVDPRVVELVYWRDVKKSAIVFTSVMLLLISLATFSVLSVVAYMSLALLTVTISFRIYKNVLQAVQKSSDGHPFKHYLNMDISLPAEKVHDFSDNLSKHVVCLAKEVRRLILVEDLVDSVKFGLLLWVMTYIGAWFNGMTLIILGVVGVFTLPKVYETYKVQIDQYLDIARTQIRQVVKTVQEKIPLPGKKKTQ